MSRKHGSILEETLSGAKVLTAQEFTDYGSYWVDPGGSARNVDLPAASAALVGQRLQIDNRADAAETLTVRLTAGGTTVATVDQNEGCVVYCVGATAPTFVAYMLKVAAT